MAFVKRLAAVLEGLMIPPRIHQLAGLISKVAADFKTTIAQEGLHDEPNQDEPGQMTFVIRDHEGPVLWLTLVYNLAGKIDNYTISAGPDSANEWDFPDLELTFPYDEFLSEVSDLDLDPPKIDYNIDILNIIAWVINAHQQIVANGSKDLDNLFDAGYYKLSVTISSTDGNITTGYWIAATSSEDARQQVIDMAGAKLVAEPHVVKFAKEQPDYS